MKAYVEYWLKPYEGEPYIKESYSIEAAYIRTFPEDDEFEIKAVDGTLFVVVPDVDYEDGFAEYGWTELRGDCVTMRIYDVIAVASSESN